MSISGEIRVRTASAGEVVTIVGWAANEGWNPGLSDASSFYAADPEGFFVAELEGEIVGSISAVRYGNDFGFVGLFIVVPEFRGRGIGLQLWAAAMARLKGTVSGLDGVVAMQAAYAASGFSLAHNNIRFGGVPQLSDAENSRHSIRRVTSPLDIAEFDQLVFGADRSAFLDAWITSPHATTLAVYDDATLRGFGTARQAIDGYKLGPVFAEDADAARELIVALIHSLPAGVQIFLDVPETNQPGIHIAEELGLTPVFETARMYRDGTMNLPLNKVFGITSFELG